MVRKMIRHQVDLAVHRIRDHAFEALAVLGAGARDALVGVHGHEFPIVPALDVIGVVIDLRLIARELIVVISGDASIQTRAYPATFRFFCAESGVAVNRVRVAGIVWTFLCCSNTAPSLLVSCVRSWPSCALACRSP